MKCELSIVAATVLAVAGVFRRLTGTPVTPAMVFVRRARRSRLRLALRFKPPLPDGWSQANSTPSVTASMCEQHRPRVGMQVRGDDPGREARLRLVRRAQRQGNADQDGRRLAGRWPPGHRSQNLVVRRSRHHGVRRHGVGVRHVRGPLRAPPQPTGVTQPTRATPPFRATANDHRRCVPHLRGLCDTVIRPRRARWCLHLANERFHLRREAPLADGRARINTQVASTGLNRCSSAARGSAPTTRSIS